MATAISSYDEYPRSSFPGAVDDWANMSDITSSTAALMTSYNSLIDSGDYDGAATFLEANPTLEKTIFNAEKINQIFDAVKAIETFYLEDVEEQVQAISNITVGINDDASTDEELAMNAFSGAKVTELYNELNDLYSTLAAIFSSHKTASVSSSGWSSSAPYTQSITVTGVTESSHPILSLYLSSSSTSTVRHNQKKAWSYVDYAESGDGVITLYCYDTKPTTTFTVQIDQYTSA